MTETVIKIENISKQYRLGLLGSNTLKGDVLSWWAKIHGKADPSIQIGQENILNSVRKDTSYNDYVWALQNINLTIEKGDVLGIIGKNGAGKSTLLKIISRITAPTTGTIKVRGRIASLLEVGTGFHPELTGRENIFQNGSILGMKKAEIKRKFDEIVEFSGVSKYIDTPVKRYSSGMYVRLAFAVAAHLEPEILIVDEVLAVGDIDFQRKAIGKIEDVSKNQGRTVLFVSHNMQAISTLTKNAVLLKGGIIDCVGQTPDVIKKYLGDQYSSELVYNAIAAPDKPSITKVEVCTSHPNNVHYFGEPLKINFRIESPHALSRQVISFRIINEYDIPVIWNWNLDTDIPFGQETGVYEIACTMPNFKLYKGRYTLEVNFSEERGKLNVISLKNICPFEVVMYEKEFEFTWVPNACVYIEENNWSVDQAL